MLLLTRMSTPFWDVARTGSFHAGQLFGLSWKFHIARHALTKCNILLLIILLILLLISTYVLNNVG